MAEELRRHDIAFSLNLNKHPKDATNLSLINAENFRISEDGSCLTLDNKIYKLDKINDKLNDHFFKNLSLSNEYVDWKIVNILSTNKEIILFVASNYNFFADKVYINNDLLGYKYLNIFRYNEEIDEISDAIISSEFKTNSNIYIKKIGDYEDDYNEEDYKKIGVIRKNALKYYGGKFSGTFTYNIKNELIIAFCEYDSVCSDKSELGEPLQIINLGYWESYKDDNNVEHYNLINENNLDPRTFPLCPEVTIPKIINDEIINGFSKKGWYNFYIRYKINNNDYTQWFNFGKSFYLDEYKEQTIFSYKATSATTGLEGTENKVWEESNYFSDETDLCNKTVKFNLENIDTKYKYYQIGFVCSTKTYNTCKITEDININNDLFILDFSSCNDYDVKEIIKIYNNYYDVKNIINYNNRLYISNYKELKNIKEENNISVSIAKNKLRDIKYKIIVNGKTIYIDLDKEYKLTDFLPFAYIFKFTGSIPAFNAEEKERELYKRGGFVSGAEAFSVLSNKFYDEVYIGELMNGKSYYWIINRILLIRANGKEETVYVTNNKFPRTEIDNITYDYWIKRFHLYGMSYEGITRIPDVTYKYNYNTKSFESDSVLPNTTNLLVSNYEYNLTQYNFKLENSYPVYEESSEYDSEFTLIPNQPYTFFIHYIDKYGQITNGNMLHLSNISDTIMYNGECYLCLYKVHHSRSDGNVIIDTHSELFYKVNSLLNFNYNTLEDFCKNNDVIFRTNAINANGEYTHIIVDKDNTNRYSGLMSYHSLNDIKTRIDSIYTELKNKNININIKSKTLGEIYSLCAFKNIKSFTKVISNEAGDFENTLFPFINYNIISYYNNQDHGILIPYKDNNTLYNISFEGITIPKEFNSYFISYEKLNKTLIHQGELRYDILDESSEYLYDLYNDNLNYKDSIKLDNFIINNKEDKIESIKYIVANDFKENNQGLSTKLRFKYNNGDLEKYNKSIHLFTDPLELNFIKNKTLIRISEISNEFAQLNIKTYGFLGNHYAIITKEAYRINAANRLLKYDSNKDLLQYCPVETDISIICYDYINHNSKQINNPPKIFKVLTNDVDFNNPTAEFYDSYMFLPQDTIDLFKNNALDFDSSVLSIYTNNADNIVNNHIFNKTIRRSNYIQTESLELSWRKFESEAYKMIVENKGNITNLIGVGQLLLVHTEDSLFQFDKNNLLTTINKTVALGEQDTFDVAYKELFTSTYGYGGLKDKESYILGEFGYIFYDYDSNKIYKYDANAVNIISSNIDNLLNKYKPNKVLFTEDKYNKRILIKIIYNKTKELYLSYNYDTSSFISIHKTEYEKGYNTKNKIYLVNKNIYSINHINVENKESKLSFIINENYSKIKRLNFIKYKLYKRINRVNDFDASLPVEESYEDIFNDGTTLKPYSGYRLRVYNDLCDTGIIDISTNEKNTDTIDNEKPHYELGNFIFNNLRDKTTKSTLYGNFFIVEFTFEGTNESGNINLIKGKIEFESLEYGINYEEN